MGVRTMCATLTGLALLTVVAGGCAKETETPEKAASRAEQAASRAEDAARRAETAAGRVEAAAQRAEEAVAHAGRRAGKPVHKKHTTTTHAKGAQG